MAGPLHLSVYPFGYPEEPHDINATEEQRIIKTCFGLTMDLLRLWNENIFTGGIQMFFGIRFIGFMAEFVFFSRIRERPERMF